MSTTSTDFSSFVPGFEFLKDLMGSAATSGTAGLPHIGSWIAPTLDPQELDKRIEQLKTVQFWLEQNTRMLQTTIQALEVQRMTLSTLQTMNVPVASVAQAFTAEPSKKKATPSRSKEAAASSDLVDPMKWWGALTQQFADLASKALAEVPAMPQTAQRPSAAKSTTEAAMASATTSKRTAGKKTARGASARARSTRV